jgi:hypothetical protein
MSVQTPQIGRLSAITVNGIDIAYHKNATISISTNIVKEYCVGALPTAQWPAAAAAGNNDGSISTENLFVDSTFSDLLVAGQQVSVIDYPFGKVTGKLMTTYQCYISSVEVVQEQEGIIQCNVEFEIVGQPVDGTAA